MSELLKNIDARAGLAGTNKLEILMFTLGADGETGRREVFGVNVFKVREVMRSPVITRVPDMPDAMEGMVSLRGRLVPVVDLARYARISAAARPEIMIVTEYNGQTQGFLVEAVDTIVRVGWSALRVPPSTLAGSASGLVTAVTELADGRLLMMLDLEQLLETSDAPDEDAAFSGLSAAVPPGRTVLFADDSRLARSQITRTLEAMSVRHIGTANGAQAWAELERLAESARAAGNDIRDHVQLVLTDVEMPEMDGYRLAKRIKADPRFRSMPVVMHSSLPGAPNRQLGTAAGIDAYVPKFEPVKLAAAISRLLA